MHNELTRKDIEDMEAEIEHRKVVVRKELLEHVKEARSLGDLSENFEYYAAKKEKNKNESRIRYLERMIRTATILDDDSKDDEVGINKTITVYVEEDDVEEEYKNKGFDKITLTTFGFQAPDFYKKLGYSLEFVREDKNPKLSKYFYCKIL